MSGSDATTVAELGEDAVIRIFAHTSAPDPRVLVPNGDDAAAFLLAPEEAVVITTDTLVEGTHFRFDWSSPESVGRKLVAVNTSDLAAMGAEPRYALLSVCFDGQVKEETVRGLASGLHERAAEDGLRLLGGNTTGIRGPAVLTLTVIGAAPPARLISRGKSRPDDAIFVTGTLGDAKAGLRALLELGPARARAEHTALVLRQNEPRAQVRAGPRLAETGLVSAMADVSDGLGRDLRRLLVPAGLGAVIEAERVPCSESLLAFASSLGEKALPIALSGGEDYELLFTAEPGAEPALAKALAPLGVRLSRIGRVSADPRFSVEAAQGQPYTLPAGFSHFD